MVIGVKHAFLGALLIASVVGPVTADPERGRDLAKACAVCHGLDGVGTNPMVPNIGGQSEMYLIKQLQDFREGRREDLQMSIIAEGLTDKDIGDVAAWYSSILATYELPPE